jgi:integrase/recombinase XerD
VQLERLADAEEDALSRRNGLTGEHDGSFVDLWLGTKVSSHTRRAYRSEIARFRQRAGKPLAAVTMADLQAYSEELGQGSLKPATWNRALTAIKSLLSFGQETGYLPFNVGVAVKLRPNPDGLAQRILEESEVARLIDRAAPGRDQVLLRLLYMSGVRVSELAQLKWRDLTSRRRAAPTVGALPAVGASPTVGALLVDSGQMTVFGKGGKTRTILLKPRIWNALLPLRGDAGPLDPVFRSRKGGHLDPSQIRRIVYAAAERAGLPRRVSPHWLRHAHASHALDRSAPIHLVQATLGHASVSTTGRYLHARPAESSSLYLPE